MKRAILLTAVLGVSLSGAITLKDVPADHYAKPYIIELANIGIFNISDGKFDGKSVLTRYDLATILGRFSKYLDEKFDVILATSGDAPASTNPDIAVNSRMGILDELEDQVEGLRNDVKVIEKKLEAGGSGLRFNGNIMGAVSIKNADSFSSESRLSYQLDRSAYDLTMTVAGYETSNMLQPVLMIEGSTTYALPLIGKVALSLSMGPREQINGVGQVVVFLGNHLRVDPVIVPAWFSLDRLNNGISVVGVGAGFQFAAMDNLIDLNWQKRYAVTQVSSIIRAGGILDNNDVIAFIFKMGASQFDYRLTIGGSHASNMFGWSGSSIGGSTLTLKSQSLGSSGVSPVLGDSYKEAGAVDVLGFPIENDSTYLSATFDHVLTQWGAGVDMKTLNAQSTFKAKLSYNVAVNEQVTVIHEGWLINDPVTGLEARALLGIKLSL